MSSSPQRARSLAQWSALTTARSFLEWLLLAGLLALTLCPILYLFWRAGDGALGASTAALLEHPPTRDRALRSALLAVAVVGASLCSALPLALAAQGLSKSARRRLDLLVTLPLAVPGYVLAYTLLAIGGDEGPLSAWGLSLPRLRGFWGATLALTLYNQPYLYLSLCAALDRLGGARWEAALSLGASPLRALSSAVLPALRPALALGALMIGLYVLGDFGVASLMHVDTLSCAIYGSWADRGYASQLALLLTAQAGAALALCWWLQRRRPPLGAVGRPLPPLLPRAATAAQLFAGLCATVGFALPLSVALGWSRLERWESQASLLAEAALSSLQLAGGGALLVVAVALPLALLARRRGGAVSGAFIGYATPPLVIALSVALLSLRGPAALRDGPLPLLLAYLVHFLLLAVGPIQATLALWDQRLGEAARSLGRRPHEVLRELLIPHLRGGLLISGLLCLLALLKELPLTQLLAPLGTRTLAGEAWGLADESRYDLAAPFALVMIIVAAIAARLSLRRAQP